MEINQEPSCQTKFLTDKEREGEREEDRGKRQKKVKSQLPVCILMSCQEIRKQRDRGCVNDEETARLCH